MVPMRVNLQLGIGVEFNSAAEAESAGYRQTGNCPEDDPVPPWEWRKRK